jgi:hypothetical protein
MISYERNIHVRAGPELGIAFASIAHLPPPSPNLSLLPFCALYGVEKRQKTQDLGGLHSADPTSFQLGVRLMCDFDHMASGWFACTSQTQYHRTGRARSMTTDHDGAQPTIIIRSRRARRPKILTELTDQIHALLAHGPAHGS